MGSEEIPQKPTRENKTRGSAPVTQHHSPTNTPTRDKLPNISNAADPTITKPLLHATA